MARPALGRGLGALLGGAAPVTGPAPPASPTLAADSAPAPNDGERVVRVPLARIHPCAFQPRKDFPEDSLRELADSIREQGVVQPLIVRSQGADYELIAGERRWRAAQLLGLTEIPVIVREADDRATLELALIENLQRENLNPIEEAQGYAQLIGQFALKQEDVAAKVGRNRATVANALRLLQLAPEVQSHLRTALISVGHAKVLLALTRAEEQRLAADRVIRDALNVRQTEDLVAHLQHQAVGGTAVRPSGSHGTSVRDTHVVDLEHRLQERFGTKVLLRYRKGKGAIEIRFFSDNDLDRVLELLGLAPD